MPRRVKIDPVVPTTALVASSARYSGKVTTIYQQRAPWQVECYRHYAICGEARFAAKFMGHAVSRATIHAETVTAGEVTRQKTGKAAELLEELFGGADGQEQMLDKAGTHLTIAGECYLVGRTGIDNGKDRWEIVSVLEITQVGKKWQLLYGRSILPVDLADDDVVIRIWLPDPASRLEADSPFKSLLPILREIEYLTLHVFSQIRSRLVSAGILFMPDDMTFPPPPEVDGKPAVTANDADAFMRTLGDVMMKDKPGTGKADEVVPIIVTAKADAIDKVKLLTFWSELDSESKELRNEAIQRFAYGMDLPPEMVLGMGSNGGTGGGRSNGVSHWGAWQIEEATIKMHIEPMLGSIVNSLTISYVRPLLDEGASDRVNYDTSALRLRPDRSKESIELWTLGVLKTEVMLMENGFSKEDMPDDLEFKRWMLMKIAMGSATPDQVGAAVKELGVDLGLPVGEPQETREARPAPSLDDHPSKPRTPDASALLAVSEALCFRALERAGNKLRSLGSRPPGVPAYEVHTKVHANGSAANVMQDAFSTAELVLDGVADSTLLVPVLNDYCMTLINEQSHHDRGRLAQWLADAGVGA